MPRGRKQAAPAASHAKKPMQVKNVATKQAEKKEAKVKKDATRQAVKQKVANNVDSSSLVSVIGNHILNPDITMPKQVEDKILKLLKDSPFDGKVKLGSACTGWVVASQAARMEPCIPHDIMFGCDNNTHVEAFARANFTILKWFQDVFEPGFIEAGHVDLFDFGAPCQPWSRANTRGHVHGADDHRAHVVVPIVKYIAAKLPKVLAHGTSDDHTERARFGIFARIDQTHP